MSGRVFQIVAGTTAGIYLALCLGCDRTIDSGVTATQGPVEIRMDTDTFLVGDIIPVHIHITASPHATLRLPSVEQGEELILVNRHVETDTLSETNERTRFHLQLQAFSAGEYTLFSEPVSLREGETTMSLPAPELQFEVRSSLTNDNEQIRAYKEPMLWPTQSRSRILAVLAGVFLVAVLIGAGVWLWRYLHRRPPPVAPVVPAHEIAIRALRDLKAKKYLDRDEVEPYFVELSAIVRHYLENRFELRAPELTTEEFIREAAVHPRLSPDQQERVHRFMQQSDLVKFARWTPGRAESDQAMEMAFELVEETRERPEREASS